MKKEGNEIYFNEEKLWNTKFIGEGGEDAGGLFRDCISDMCEELQSNAIDLFCKTQNQKNDFGEQREKWVLNPSSKKPIHIEML